MKIRFEHGRQYLDERFADVFPPITVTTFEVELDAMEFAPDEVFAAANRVMELDEEPRRLRDPWQMEVRKALDVAKAPSMSVEDRFTVYSDSGQLVVCWQVERFGWSNVTREVMA